MSLESESEVHQEIIKHGEAIKENFALRMELEHYRSIAEREGASIAISEKEKLHQQLIDLKQYILDQICYFENAGCAMCEVTIYKDILNRINL